MNKGWKPEGEAATASPSRAHESAALHVTGRAEYIDDMPEPEGLLHAYLGLSESPAGRISELDLSAVLAAPGVVGVLTAEDAADNDISPVGKHDDPILAQDVTFHGQPIFAVVAETRAQARAAARVARVTYDERAFATDIDGAEALGLPLVTEPLTLARGDAEAALAAAPHVIRSEMRIGGQDHFYLETHIAMAVPGDDGSMAVWSGTQHPSEVQHMVAHALDLPSHAVTVHVRRMGGAFGGKETQGNIFAVVAALAARRWGRAVKIRPDRDDDMVATGKRHDFRVRYAVGFDDDGRIQGVQAVFAARCGNSADLSGPVTDRALFHADNACYYPAVHLRSEPRMTNTVSNTAFRGFGGPQGVVAAERIIEDIAYALGRDPLEIRKLNFYRPGQQTPYHQTVEDEILPGLVAELEKSSDYAARRAAILRFNRDSAVERRGIALTPVKFGISFTATWYNQAGALVHVYQDGSVMVSHGGTEMGQGLHTKVQGVVAEVFGLPPERVRVVATATDKVPNTSATAASSGADLNGMAAHRAATTITDRLAAFWAERCGVAGEAVRFEDGCVVTGDSRIPFAEVVRAAYMARVQLWSDGFYATPKIHWDRAKGTGRPFYYYAYGAAVSEVSVDTLTGEYRVLRTDILHDVGNSLNPAIDIGQIEGGFIQGMGWLTTEELWWDQKGRLRTHAPSTYKIPLASDRPRIFNIALADWSHCREMTIKRSKAVGEPPLMLAASVLEALGMAVASLADYRENPRLDAPATPERVLLAAERLRGR
jgi:xanthine dehydrogenase large subunit